MIAFYLIATLLIILACAVFAIPLLKTPKVSSGENRDAVNKAYYRYRLAELDEDEKSGIIAQREELVKELQQNLLVDIPQSAREKIREKPIERGVIAIGVVFLITLTLFSYSKTGALENAAASRAAEANYSALRAKYDLDQLTHTELSAFAQALRAQIAKNPDNIQDLLTLGEVGMRLNSYSIAHQAFAHAYRLEPNNPTALSFYGYITLMYAQSDSEAKFALSLLNQSLRQNPDNLFVIKALAFYALESKNTELMLYYWSMWLDKLPENSPSRPMVKSTLEQIKSGTID